MNTGKTKQADGVLAPVSGRATDVAVIENLYALSKDYRVAFDLVRKGLIVVGFVDYRFRTENADQYPASRDVCRVKKSGHRRIDFGVRGVCYGSVDPWGEGTEWALFQSECERMNFEFIVPQHCR